MHEIDSDILRLHAERLTVAVKRLVTGRFRLSTTTDVHETEAVAELVGTEVEVTRVPVNRRVEAAPSYRQDGETTIISVVEEVITIQKHLVVTEEIHIRRRPTLTTFRQPVELRRQTATVERTDLRTGAVTTEILNPLSKDAS